MMDSLFSDRMIEAAGWAVIHSLWQGALIAIVLAVALALIDKKRSQVRYMTAYSGLVLCLAAFVATFVYYWDALAGATLTGMAPAGAAVEGVTNFGPFTTALGFFDGYLPLVFRVWIIGFGFLLLRMLVGLAYTRHMKSRLDTHLPEPLERVVEKLKAELRIDRDLLIGISKQVTTACVVGVIKPAILIPVGMVNGLDDQEVEAILAHEVAHIARKDYLFNLIQSFIESVLYFNPAVWWISAEVKNSREHCCDDFAIRLCGSELAYARALVKAEELRKMPALSRPVALSFLGGREKLIHRVKRILHQPEKNTIAMEKILFSAGLLFCMLFLNAFDTPHTDETVVSEVQERSLEVFLPELAALDSVPPKVIEKITRREGDKEVQATYENGELKELKVDGRDIPESEREQYSEALRELEEELKRSNENHLGPMMELRQLGHLKALEEMKALEKLKELEDMDMEFEFEFPPMPEMPEPPADLDMPEPPPAPQFFGLRSGKSSYRVETEEGEDGSVTVRIQSDGGEPMEIKIDGDHEVIVIDGEEVKAGDAVKILDDRYNKFFHTYTLPDGEWKVRYREAEEEMRKQMENQRQHQQEMMEREREQMQEIRERQREQQQEVRERMREAQRQHERAVREAEERVIVTRPEGERYVISSGDGGYAFFRSGNLEDRIARELVRDGVIKEGESYTLKLNGNKMKVNGNKLSDELHEKYMKLYEESTGTDVSKSKIIIENN